MLYNTQQKRIALPEYGRNIQNMVDHCITIADKDERKKCAYNIVDIMGNMFPHLRDVNDFKHILWDHLAIMADFKLDIEYPFEVVTPDTLHSAPSKLEYNNPKIRFKHYGSFLEKMITIAAEMEEGDKRKFLVEVLATQMKKSYTQWNKEVDDAKIFEDMLELSDGKIKMDESFVIPETKQSNHRGKINASKIARRR